MLDYIINYDQRGFIPNRRIAAGIRKVYDTVMDAYTSEKKGVLINLDFSKAFDRLESCAVLGALEYFGFSNMIMNWTQILYNSFTVNVQNNGYFSADIDVTRGVHQGAPASSLYFILVAETLAIELRTNPKIEPYYIQDIVSFLNQYADDMSVSTAAEEGTISEVFKILDNFERQSGLKANYDKTTLHRLGSLKQSEAKRYTTKGLSWESDELKVLGVYIGHDEDDNLRKNYEKLIDQSRTLLDMWKKRSLSLMGKINVINTLIASLFVYKMSVLPLMSNRYIQELEDICVGFIWDNHRPKIPLQILKQDKRRGGAGLVDFRLKDQSLKIAWIKTVQQDPPCGNIGLALLHEDMDDLIWSCNIKPQDVHRCLSDTTRFWRDVLESWAHINYNSQEMPTDEHSPIIWLNSNIRINDTPVLWKECFYAGLINVLQLFQQDGYLPDADATRLYGLTTMKYNALKSAIPKDWRKAYKSNPSIRLSEDECERSNTAKIENLRASNNVTRQAYTELQEKVRKSTKLHERWNNILNADLTEDDIYKLCLVLRSATCIMKYRSFQYRVINMAITTNRQLFKWGKVDSDMCFHCELERETVHHMFITCIEVQELWTTALRIIKEITDMEYPINDACDKLLGNANYPPVVNLILIVVKQYIYRQRCLKKGVNVYELKRLIYSIKNTEKFYAIKDNTTDKFKKKMV